MSDDEDDYLSDKFLIASASAPPVKPKTYSDLRKEAQRKAFIKNEENRRKSRREREVEAREEGLSKSLFERAKEEQDAGSGSGIGSKAMAMMIKMGFKPGQSLGRPEEEDEPEKAPEASEAETPKASSSSRKTEPIPLNEWEGRKGIGTRKRALSPTGAERIAKMAKMAETSNHADFRDRAAQDYAERRAEGRLVSAQRTCATLDEKDGKTFNVLWLNPGNPDSFPPGLMEALQMHTAVTWPGGNTSGSLETRLRQQIQSDALHPLDADTTTEIEAPSDNYSTELLEEVAQFLRLQAQDRLHLVLSYLRDRYTYCFWCGTQYQSEDEMDTECPGIEEDDH